MDLISAKVGWIPLLYASQNGVTWLVHRLLEGGANPDQQDKVLCMAFTISIIHILQSRDRSVYLNVKLSFVLLHFLLDVLSVAYRG